MKICIRKIRLKEVGSVCVFIKLYVNNVLNGWYIIDVNKALLIVGYSKFNKLQKSNSNPLVDGRLLF